MPEFNGTGVFKIDENGKAMVSRVLAGRSPTQEQLYKFVDRYREEITSLSVFADNFTMNHNLDFEALGVMPNLKILELSWLYVKEIKFTSYKTPALERLYLQNLMTPSSHEVKFDLNLPKLRFLTVKGITVAGRTDFGLCVSRCSNLEGLMTRKLRLPKGSNVMILPKCRKALMEHCDLTDNVEVLHAPYLEEFSVNGSFDLRHVRLWDIPNEMNAGDLHHLKKDYEKAKKQRGKALWREKKKWREEEYDGTDACNKGWITKDEVEFFHYLVKNDTRFKVMKALEAEVDSEYENSKLEAVEGLMERVSHRPKVRPEEGLPTCEVRSMNALLDTKSLLHLDFIKRVKHVEVGLSFLR